MPQPEPQQVHAAAAIVLWRKIGARIEVLMGQRGAAAVFMPSKYVFPGGRVDPGDSGDPGQVSPRCLYRLGLCTQTDPTHLIGAALRELVEETGLALRSDLPGVLRLIFRAITPPGRPRRFDAWFFLAPATALLGDADDFSRASDELSHLHWIGLTEARGLDLPFITEVVIAEVASLLAGQDQPGVPFFDNSGPVPIFRRLD